MVNYIGVVQRSTHTEQGSVDAQTFESLIGAAEWVKRNLAEANQVQPSQVIEKEFVLGEDLPIGSYFYSVARPYIGYVLST